MLLILFCRRAFAVANLLRIRAPEAPVCHAQAEVGSFRPLDRMSPCG